MADAITLEQVLLDMADCQGNRGVGHTYSRLTSWRLAIDAAIKQREQDTKDASRLDWLEAHPRLASIVIDGNATDCYLYGVSGAMGLKLREILDIAMAKESGNDVPVPDVRLTRAEFDALADLLEAQEKAKPVATVEDQFGFPIMEWIGDAGEKCPVGTNLYTHSAQAQPPADQFDPERNVRPGDVGTELQTAEQDAANFGTGFEVDGRRVAPERVRIFRGEHAAQPPAASVTDTLAVFEVVSGVEGPCLTISRKADGKPRHEYRLAGPKPWGGGNTTHSFKVHTRELREQIDAIEAALAAQEKPNG